MSDRERFAKACEKMDCQYWSAERFVFFAVEWLAAKLGDLHIEYHRNEGWQVSTCYEDGNWSEDGWLSADDGTLAGALLLAVEKVPTTPHSMGPLGA